jgi:hypothetical protein
MGSIGSRCTFVRRLYREIRAVPGSTTYRMPGTVSDVSATLVARTTRRPRMRREDSLLLGGRKPCVKRQHLRVLHVTQRFCGVADLALTGQEDQHVAGWFLVELVYRVDDGLGLIAHLGAHDLVVGVVRIVVV